MTTITAQERVEKIGRAELLAALVKRDGDRCQYPDCGDTLNFSMDEGPLEVTIDHWMPQYWCKEQGWSYEAIWDLSNLKLMHKRCNAKKGDRIPDENGVLPPRVTREFRYRRQKRATRVGLCAVCDNGHNLASDEVCASCGGDAQAYPRWAKVKFQECKHDGIFWCWACSIGVVEKRGAYETMVFGGEGGQNEPPEEVQFKS